MIIVVLLFVIYHMDFVKITVLIFISHVVTFVIDFGMDALKLVVAVSVVVSVAVVKFVTA